MMDAKNATLSFPLERPLYVAFDIEKAGANFDNEVLQVGVAFSFGLGEHVQTQSFCFAYDTIHWEQRCVEQFWDKQPPELKARIMAEAKEAKGQWQELCNLIDAFDSMSKNVKPISDNPSYDITYIDYGLWQYCKRRGLHYSRKGDYRSITDPSERIKGLPKAIREKIEAKVDSLAVHDHWAANDAKHILLTHLYVDAIIQLQDQGKDLAKDPEVVRLLG